MMYFNKVVWAYICVCMGLLLWSIPVHAVEMTSFSQNSDTVRRYAKYEATFTLDTDFANPFDANVIAIDALMTCPDQTQKTVPAFWYRQYQVVETLPEDYVNPGPGSWKIRFSPAQTGTYEYDLRVTENDSTVTTLASIGSFTCIDSNKPGIVRLDPNDVHCLRYDDGSPRINIGHNVCWTSRGFYGFNEYFQAMQAVGENWTRLWMTHFYNCSILEWRPNSSGYFAGLGRYSLQVAQRLDAVIEAAEQAGIAIQLVLQHHGQFSTSVNPNWNDNPYNVARGGMLEHPEDFFSDAEARRLTRNKYRYIVARWGYSSSILAWELWNEVQFTNGWQNDREAVVQWHKDMSDYLRRIDPHEHLITTSSDTGEAFAPIWNLDNIDIIQHHQYGNPLIKTYSDALAILKDNYDKPVIMGEYGIGSGNPENDPNTQPEPQRTQILEGLVLHNGIWASYFTKSSAHLWWWDNYIHPQDLYNVFLPLHLYAQNESLSTLQPAPHVVSGYQSMSARPLIQDFWGVSTQTEFWYDGERFAGMENLNTYLHGSDKSEYRSDPVFHLTLPSAGHLIISVNTVSSWGNNRIRIWINETPAYEESLTNGRTQFALVFPLEAGEQTVQIENIGQDWVQISQYEFRPVDIARTNSLGLMGDDRAYLWIYDIDNEYGKVNHGILANETITVPDLTDGRYDVTVWDTTHEGGIIEQAFVDTNDQTLTYTLPDFIGDIAVKIKPAPIVDSNDMDFD